MVTYPQVIFLSNILSPLVFLPSCSLSSFVSYSLPLVTFFSIFIEQELIACQMSLLEATETGINRIEESASWVSLIFFGRGDNSSVKEK